MKQSIETYETEDEIKWSNENYSTKDKLRRNQRKSEVRKRRIITPLKVS